MGPRLLSVRRDAAIGLMAISALACGQAAETKKEAPAAPILDETPTVPKGAPPSKAPPAHVVGEFSFDAPPMTLAPGEEAEPCWLFPLEMTGPSRIVGGASLAVGPGMHHGNITTRKKTGEGVRECPPESHTIAGEASDILEGGAVLFASSTQIEGTEWQSFPDGTGFRVREGYEIVARMHYLNPTSEALTVAPKYVFYLVDEATIDHEVGPFAWVFKTFEIPPKSDWTVTGGCKFPAPMHLVELLPHMHGLGTAFTASFLGGPLDGEMFMESRGYNPEGGVILAYDPAVDLSQGEGASFSCTWHNTFDKPIVEGIGDNEMCILFGYAYPPENAFSAMASGPGQCAALAPPSE